MVCYCVIGWDTTVILEATRLKIKSVEKRKMNSASLFQLQLEEINAWSCGQIYATDARRKFILPSV